MTKTIQKLLAITGVLVITAFAATDLAQAGPFDTNHPAFAVTGTRTTSIPVGHAEFCAKHPAECRANTNVVSVQTLDNTRWQELVDVNIAFNSTIVPVTDEKLYHVAEYWTYPNGYGDCEDFALAKRRDLIAKGWPASTLLLTVVRQENGEGHAVLIARTDRGDLVLDNQEGLIKLWNDTPYRFIKRQSQADAGKWVDIYDDRSLQIAAR